MLSWEATKLVACHGQSPLEGPELKAMLHIALGRYRGGAFYLFFLRPIERDKLFPSLRFVRACCDEGRVLEHASRLASKEQDAVALACRD